MRILIDKALELFYVIGKSNICKHGNILLSLTLKENTISNMFYNIHIIEIPTNKGANSYKLKISKIGNWTYMCIWTSIVYSVRYISTRYIPMLRLRSTTGYLDNRWTNWIDMTQPVWGSMINKFSSLNFSVSIINISGYWICINILQVIDSVRVVLPMCPLRLGQSVVRPH